MSASHPETSRVLQDEGCCGRHGDTLSSSHRLLICSGKNGDTLSIRQVSQREDLNHPPIIPPSMYGLALAMLALTERS